MGFTWARQYGFRVVRDFGGKVAVALSVEGPQATVGGRGLSTFTSATGTVSQHFFIGAPGAGGGFFNFVDTTGYSINKSPDIIARRLLIPASVITSVRHYQRFP